MSLAFANQALYDHQNVLMRARQRRLRLIMHGTCTLVHRHTLNRQLAGH